MEGDSIFPRVSLQAHPPFQPIFHFILPNQKKKKLFFFRVERHGVGSRAFASRVSTTASVCNECECQCQCCGSRVECFSGLRLDYHRHWITRRPLDLPSSPSACRPTPPRFGLMWINSSWLVRVSELSNQEQEEDKCSVSGCTARGRDRRVKKFMKNNTEIPASCLMRKFSGLSLSKTLKNVFTSRRD